MFPNPDLSPARLRRPGRAARKLGWLFAVPVFALVFSVALAGCNSLPWKPTRAEEEAAQKAHVAAQARAAAQAKADASAASNPEPPPAPPALPAVLPVPDVVVRVLVYAERVRTMPTVELNQELARMTAPSEANAPASRFSCHWS